ncbi:hypothetical protein GN330_14085 [Nitratireductor sp. CAU 1489]|uniref:Uncharacterized protein n=1 Tax=Nitratireductor arenosus TaxID=2682096 RepID=A0A844QIF4_9HYPH|nr:hypothetical protein [Nitratireductor arenosus]MVA98374.1 hypothetical protein [Nitratireductor arenosus]
MAYSRNPFLQAARAKPAAKRSTRFWASPAGRHLKLARNCFALAKRHKYRGNRKKYWAMLAMGRRALALSKAEVRLWKRGNALRRRSFSVQRARA